jgi:hypothetical protein
MGNLPQDRHYGVSEQGKARRHRWDDAQALYAARRWRGAMYIAGYAVECLLKVKLMQMYDCRHLRELEKDLVEKGILSADASIFTHHLELLLRCAHALDRLRQSEPHWRSFNMVNRWVPAWRYAADLADPRDAEDFLTAVDDVSRWIENNI